MVVAHYLGVPDEDRDQFDGWTDAIVAANASGFGALGSVGDAIGSMMAYFAQLIERRRREPGDDTVSHLVAAGSAPTVISPGHSRCWPSPSPWSPAATTPPPECSAAQCNCSMRAPISAACSSSGPT